MSAFRPSWLCIFIFSTSDKKHLSKAWGVGCCEKQAYYSSSVGLCAVRIVFRYGGNAVCSVILPRTRMNLTGWCCAWRDGYDGERWNIKNATASISKGTQQGKRCGSACSCYPYTYYCTAELTPVCFFVAVFRIAYSPPYMHETFDTSHIHTCMWSERSHPYPEVIERFWIEKRRTLLCARQVRGCCNINSAMTEGIIISNATINITVTNQTRL